MGSNQVLSEEERVSSTVLIKSSSASRGKMLILSNSLSHSSVQTVFCENLFQTIKNMQEQMEECSYEG